MPAYSVTILPNAVNIDPTPSGVEFANDQSRRLFYCYPITYVRLQYEGDATVDLAVRLEFSLDDGATWQTLITGPTIITRKAMSSDWLTPPDAANVDRDLLIRGVAIGTAGGHVIYWVQLDYR